MRAFVTVGTTSFDELVARVVANDCVQGGLPLPCDTLARDVTPGLETPFPLGNRVSAKARDQSQPVTDCLEALKFGLPVKVLKSLGYNQLVLQIGRGTVVPEPFSTESFTLDVYRYKDSLKEDLQQADLVISHAGAGSCLESLEKGKPLVVVVNEKLMNNHQLELAKQLHKEGHLFYCTCRVSLCSSGCPGTHYVDQANLELRNPPASASQVLGLKACPTNARQEHAFQKKVRACMLPGLLQSMDLSTLKCYPPGQPEKFSAFLDKVVGLQK
ncbi:N-acetylglucosaminyldiphosphodolichol N-acetylglucosaminyltransferase [Apodemus speciosus]|uniref:UDP-N-acetylglucosamine transferase subunit ALG13 n=1 Tax=Apodemus speciosus TaxID=105296 RepID=A0ABQ0FVC5_APOSI